MNENYILRIDSNCILNNENKNILYYKTVEYIALTKLLEFINNKSYERKFPENLTINRQKSDKILFRLDKTV